MVYPLATVVADAGAVKKDRGATTPMATTNTAEGAQRAGRERRLTRAEGIGASEPVTLWDTNCSSRGFLGCNQNVYCCLGIPIRPT
jgi:hypothetical protein